MRTITAARDVDRLFSEGSRAARDSLVVLCVQTDESRDPSLGRVIFVAGKRLGGAVFRNRCKRVLREACRRAEGPWAGFDVALIARHQTAHTSPEKLDKDLSAALKRAGVLS